MGSGPELVVVLAATVVACAASTVGGAAWGWLEAHGRQTLVHSLVAAVAVVGLAVTVVAARATSSFVALSLVNLATTVAPFLLAVGWIVRREVPRAPSTPSAVAASQRATLQATARAVPPLGARALDPLLIAPSLGAASAGAYGLGQRLSLPNTLVIQATAPVVASDLARRRGGGEDLAMGVVARVALLQALASAACGAVLVIVGPWLGGVLSHHELVVPRSLFVAFGVAGVVFSASESLASVSSGPRGLAVGWRIDGIGLVVNVVASLVLLGPLGMAGPVWGSAAAASVTLAIWIVVHARRPDLRSETHGDEPCGGPPLVWAPLDDRPPGGDQLGREQLGGHVDSWRSAAPTSTGAGS